MAQYKNFDLRLKITENGLKFKDVAKVAGYNKDYFSKLMSGTLSEKTRKKIEVAIDYLISAKGDRENDI